MYQAHWGLTRVPFATSLVPHCFYTGSTQTESLARLRYLTNGRRRLGLLVGNHGAGKTLLLDRFARERQRDGRTVAIVCAAGLTAAELYWKFAAELSLGPRDADQPTRLFRQFTDYAATSRLLGNHAALLLDDVDQAGPDLLAHVARLMNICPAANWLTVILTTNPSDASRLGPALHDAIDMRIEVEPWDESETIGYVQHALFQAGAERALFSDDALTAVFTLSGGVPRRVNRIAERSLIIAAVDGADSVETQHVDEAAGAVACS